MGREMRALPSTLFKAALVKLMSLYSTHGALFGMNFHMTPHLPVDVFNSSELSISFSSSTAERCVDVLSDIISVVGISD